MARVFLLLIGCAALALSSIVLQSARHSLRRGRLASYRKLLLAAVALGIVFLLSQTMAWSELALQGVFLKGNPHGSMWFSFTGFPDFLNC